MTAMIKSSIDTMADLRAERIRLKGEIFVIETQLKEEYSEIADKARSVGNIFTTVSKVGSMFSGHKQDNDAEDEDRDYSQRSPLVSVLKVAVPIIAGGFFLKRKRNLILKSLFGYGLGQAAKYFMSKNIGEHVQDVKHVFHKDKSDYEEYSSEGKHDIF